MNVEHFESQKRITHLKSLPENIFAGIYAECDRNGWAGCQYNSVYYSEWEIYFASLERVEGYEVLL